jgi:hypothetical protein
MQYEMYEIDVQASRQWLAEMRKLLGERLKPR